MLDEALGTAVLGGRLARRAAVIALAPARAVWASPLGAPGRAFARRAELTGAETRAELGELARAVRQDLEAAPPALAELVAGSTVAARTVDAVLASPIPEQIVDRVLSGELPGRVVDQLFTGELPDRVVDHLIARGTADRTVTELIREGVVERAISSALRAHVTEDVVAVLLADGVPERVVTQLIESGVISRVAAQVLSEFGLGEELVQALLGGPMPGIIATEGAQLAQEVADDPRTTEFVENLLGSPAVEQLVGTVLESPATLALTERILSSPEMQKLLETIAASPEIRTVITEQSAGIVSDVTAGVRTRSVRLDDAAERAARRLLRRDRP